MNTIKKMAMAMAVCGALCGTTMAAPRGGAPQGGGKAPTTQRAPQQKTQPGHVAKAPGKAHNVPKAKPAPQPAPRHEVAHHKPAPRPEPRHNKHHGTGTLHTGDWCSIGASLVGGIIGGLIGSAM